MSPVGLGGILYGQIAPYASLNLTVASPPQSFTEPLSVAEAKKYINLPARVDDEEDALISSMITGARIQAETAQARDLVLKQWDLSFDYFIMWQIRLRSPLVSVDLVRYRDSNGDYTSLTENVDYIVDGAKEPGIIAPAYNKVWPSFTAWPSSAVLVRFTSGFLSTDIWWSGACGERVKLGMRMLISAWYNNRLPFEIGASAIQEYPYAVTSCLGYGGSKIVR